MTYAFHLQPETRHDSVDRRDQAIAFDGLAGQRWRGSAFFLGPTFHYQFNDKVDLSGAWTQQLAGAARGGGANLDLAHFSRSAAKLRLEVDF